jgi:alcohol dehydrogenase class IV
MAREFKAQMVIGIGGGSSMDSAKAIAVEAVHEGTILDYLFYTPGPTAKTLPIITVGTTAGTGSQVGPGAVITNTAKKDKTALWSDYLFPVLAIVDPDLTASMPPSVTSQTGFDAFCHGFEALMSNNGNPHSACLALDAIKRVVQYLPQAIADGGDMEARSQMAWADTLAGYAIAESGVTLPHGLGMQISGHCPHVTHGQSLAVTYPEFTRFTWESDIPHFAAVGRIFNPSLNSASDKDDAKQCCEEIDAFLKKIDLWIGFSDLNVSKENLWEIADCGQVLGDYKNNPRIATIDEMYQILIASYTRS